MSKLKINMFYTLIYILCNCFRFISPILASYLAQNLYVLYISHSSGICTLEILKNRQTKIKSIENINEFLNFHVICNLIVPIQIFHSHLSKTTTRFWILLYIPSYNQIQNSKNFLKQKTMFLQSCYLSYTSKSTIQWRNK